MVREIGQLVWGREGLLSRFLGGFAMKRFAALAMFLAFVVLVGTTWAEDKPNPTGTWKWKVDRGGQERGREADDLQALSQRGGERADRRRGEGHA